MNSRRRNAESPIDRKKRQFDAIVNAELVIDIREMALHGVHAEIKGRCDVFVAVAIYDSLDNLHFPMCQTQTCNFPIRIPGMMTSSGISQRPARGTVRQVNVTTFTYTAPRGYKGSDTFAIYGVRERDRMARDARSSL